VLDVNTRFWIKRLRIGELKGMGCVLQGVGDKVEGA